MTNRKFCLKCSPWGGHNTRAKIDESDIDKSSIGWKERRKYKYWSEERKRKQIERTSEKGRTRKINLVKSLGGKCLVCGYDKCINSMNFHHLDPSSKVIALDQNNLRYYSFEDIKEEAVKCVLLCANCHAEIHAGLLFLDDETIKNRKFDFSYLESVKNK